MTRSVMGLAGAGEWETVKSLLPDVKGKDILDLGCGFGWHAAYFAENGCRSVDAVDASEKMISRAKLMHSGSRIRYSLADIEDIEIAPDSYDLIFSSLVFHYIRDYDSLVQKIFRGLSKGGTLLFSCEHPIYTAEGSEDWCCNEDGTIKHFPVDRYFAMGTRETSFLGKTVEKQHRTLTGYIMPLIENGFVLSALKEPEVPEHLKHLKEMENEWRRPMMLVVRADKK